jgi:hypothetical protein
MIFYDKNTGKLTFEDTASIAALPAGSTTQIQYNNAGAFGASANFVFSGSRVGIGTPTPLVELHISASAGYSELRLDGLAGSGGSLEFYGTGSALADIYANPSKDLIFRTNGTTEQVRILANGNVGIGIAQSNAGGKVTLYIDNNASSTLSNEATIKFSVDAGASATNGGAEISTINVNAINGNSDLTFKTFNISTGFTEKVRFTTNGNVGIGTTNPYGALNVQSTAGSWGEGIIINPVNAATSNFGAIFFRLSGSFGSAFTGTWALSKETSESTGGEVLQVLKQGLSSGVGVYRTDALQQWKPDGNVLFGNNVGIGTATPVGKLFVGSTWDTTFGGNDIYVKNTANRNNFDPNVTNTSDFGVVISQTSSNTSGSDKVGLVLYNNDTTAGGFSPMLIFAKRESGATPYKAAMAGIYARSPLGTGDGNNWIDGELIFATAGAATQGIVQRMVISKEGNVGIGTTNPNTKLNVPNGEISTEVFSFSDVNGITPLNTVYMAAPRSATAAIFTNSTERLTVTSTGNIGIGVTNPDQPLAFTDSLGTKIQFNGINSNGYQIGLASAVTGGDAMFKFTAGETGAGEFGFYNTTNLRMLITAGGNVGIGTTNPTSDLHVYDNADVWHARFGSANGELRIGGSTGNGAVIQAYTPATVVRDLYIQRDGGNVGIGTTTPLSKLHVQGDIRASLSNVGQANVVAYNTSTGLFTYLATSSISSLPGGSDGQVQYNNGGVFGGASDLFYDDATGNVGVGTAAPTRQLDVYENSTVQIVAQFANSSSVSSRIKFADLNTGAENVNIGAIGTRMAMWTNNTERMSILSGGNIGIGSGIALVAGSGAFSTADMVLLDGGNVGIGTTSPGSKLTVYSDTTADGILVDVLSRPRITLRDRGNSDTILGTGDYGLDDFFIDTYSGNAFAIDGATRNVGIGTTSPGVALQISRAAATAPVLALQTTDSTSNGYISWRNNTGVQNAAIGTNYGVSDTGAIEFISGSATNMILRSSGNLGIGTTNPSEKLEVTDGGFSINRSTDPYIRFKESGTSIADIFADTSDNNLVVRGSTSHGVEILANGASEGSAHIKVITTGNVGIANTNPTFRFVVNKATQAAPAIMVGGALYGGPRIQTYDLVADSKAWMGLGTDMSGAPYEHNLYYSDTGTLGRLSIGTYSGSVSPVYSEKAVFNRVGNLGIGTTNPTATLSVLGGGGTAVGTTDIVASFKRVTASQNAYIAIDTTSAGRDSGIRFGEAGTNTWTILSYKSSSPDGFGFYNHSASAFTMFLGDDNNVGIRTSSPYAPLHVRVTGTPPTSGQQGFFGSVVLGGDASQWNRLRFDTAGTGSWGVAVNPNRQFAISRLDSGFSGTPDDDNFIIDTTGNIGIGLTTPTANLHINGDLKASLAKRRSS